MAKKKRNAQTPEERLHALAECIDRAAERLQLAARALRIAQCTDDPTGYFERCYDHIRHDIASFSERAVFFANIWPQACHESVPHDAPKELQHLITGEIHEPRPSSCDDHANTIFCRVMHRRLPPQFSKEWRAWKTHSASTLAACAGAREALQARVALAEENAAALRAAYAIDVNVTRFGELELARFDAWPELHIGSIDEERYKIVERITWGFSPDETAPQEHWLFDDDEHHEIYEYRSDGGGEGISWTGEGKHGLMIAVKRVFCPPVPGENVRLEHVPQGRYRLGRTVKQRSGSEPRSTHDTLVTYAGETKPQEQLALL